VVFLRHTNPISKIQGATTAAEKTSERTTCGIFSSGRKTCLISGSGSYDSTTPGWAFLMAGGSVQVSVPNVYFTGVFWTEGPET
jgi:hypothetical protein